MNQAIYRKYRPQGWGEVIGQDHVVQTLRNAILQDRVGHAYLFAGPRGTGKTTLARLLAKAVNCLAEDRESRPCNQCEHCRAVNENRFLDLIELDAASNTGVDDVRDLRDKIGFSPSQARSKVYIIDEVHMLSTQAFNALLKTLEEPPPHAMFILATTEIHKIPATVLSRCQRHEFRRVALSEIVGNLRSIAKAEGWNFDEEALALIARQSTGSVRDAQSLMDQLASSGKQITLELAQQVLGSATSQAVLELLDAVQANNAAGALHVLATTLDSGVDPRSLARQITDYVRNIMLVQMGNADQSGASKEVQKHAAEMAAAFPPQAVLGILRAFNRAATDSRTSWQPSLALELAVAESISIGESAGEKPIPNGGRVSGQGYSPGRPESSPRQADRRSVARSQSGEADHQKAVASTDPLRREQATESAISRAGGSAPSGADIPPPVDLAKVSGAWMQIRSTLKGTHPAVDGLLNSCRPVEVRGDELVLGFKTEAVRAIMEKPENLDAARRAFAAALGYELRLRCEVINSRGQVPPDLRQDGMVAAALNQGGEIVDMHE